MITNRSRFVVNRLVVLLLSLTGLSWSQSVAKDADDSLVDPQTVNPTTIVLLKLKTEQLQLPNWLNDLGSESPERRLEKTRDAVKNVLDWMRQVSGSSQLYVTVDVPYTSAQPVVRMMVANQDPTRLDSVKQQLARYSAGAPVVVDDFVVASPTHSLEDASYQLDDKIMPATHPAFDQAAKAVSEYPVQILVVPPRYLADTFDELLPQLPDQLGGGPTSVLTQGMRWAAIGIEPNRTKLLMRIQSDNPPAAEALASRLPTLLKSVLGQVPEQHAAVIAPYSKALLSLMKTEVVNDQIHVSFDGLDIEESPAEVLAAVLDNLTGPLRPGKKNRLRSIVLGILNYESANRSMPPGKQARNANGKSNLSWRVHILPYLEENELYSQFHLDEPWDSPHNLKLLDQMPKVFNAHSVSILGDTQVKPGYTTFVAPVGEGTIFGGDKVTKMRNIKDGTSKTLVVLEVKPELAVPWTAPQDYRFDANAPGSGLAWGADDATGVMTCDCAWHLIPKNISDETLLRLFQMNDGMPVGFE